MADPWDEFAQISDAEAAQFNEFAPVDGSAVDSYRASLQAAIARGDAAEVHRILRANGADPAKIKGLGAAIAAGKRGRQVGVVVDGETPRFQAPATAGSVSSAVARGTAEGVTDVADLLLTPGQATPLGAIADFARTGLGAAGIQFPSLSGMASGLADAAGFGALSPEERIAETAGRGAAAGAITGGGGLASTVINTLGGAVAGGAQEGLAEAGYGTGIQTAGALAAGAGVGGLAGILRRLTARIPAEVVVDASGALTEEGRELAARNGVPEEEMAREFARARRSGNRDTRTVEERQASREAIRNRAPSEGNVPARPVVETGREPAPVAPNLNARTDAIVRGIEERLPQPQPQPQAEQLFSPPRDPGNGIYDEAMGEDIRLSRGQAEQRYDIQLDENNLRNTHNAPEAEEARQFFQAQQRQIGSAIDRFRANFGPDAGNAADRGEQLQAAVRELRDAGAEGVRQLYRNAEELGGDALTLDTAGIRDAATDVLIDEAVPEAVKRAVSQELARYGIVGTAEATNEVGLTRVTLDDGSTIQFRGPVKQLTAANAEDLRRAINRLYDPTKPNLSGQSIKPAIDQALEEAVTGAANRQGMIGNAYREARAGYQQQQRTFKAGDIIEKMVASKRDKTAFDMLPERAIAQTIGAGKDGVTNLRKVKALLQSGGTDSSRQAWAAIQHQTIADVFDAAWSRNVNHGDGQIGDVISGAKLNSAIERFGVDKLRIVLSPEDFNGLMKLRRIIGAATIPISGTANVTNSGNHVINFLRQSALRTTAFVPGLSSIVDSGGKLLAKAKNEAATRRTLEGIVNYRGAESARQIDQRAADFVRDYIETGKTGRYVPATINLNSGGGSQ